MQCRTKRSPLNQSLARKITNFPSKKNMPPIRLRDQFGFRPHLDLHHDSLLLHRISELPTSNWSLSDNPAGLAPKSVGASMLFKFGPWIGMACRKSHCFNIAWSWGKKNMFGRSFRLSGAIRLRRWFLDKVLQMPTRSDYKMEQISQESRLFCSSFEFGRTSENWCSDDAIWRPIGHRC